MTTLADRRAIARVIDESVRRVEAASLRKRAMRGLGPAVAARKRLGRDALRRRSTLARLSIMFCRSAVSNSTRRRRGSLLRRRVWPTGLWSRRSGSASMLTGSSTKSVWRNRRRSPTHTGVRGRGVYRLRLVRPAGRPSTGCRLGLIKLTKRIRWAGRARGRRRKIRSEYSMKFVVHWRGRGCRAPPGVVGLTLIRRSIG